jgi:hypothetical protein
MHELPKLPIAKALLREDETARRKSFPRQRSLKLTGRNSISRLTKMRAREELAVERTNSLQSIAATTAFYGTVRREKEPAFCSKSERPPT